MLPCAPWQLSRDNLSPNTTTTTRVILQRRFSFEDDRALLCWKLTTLKFHTLSDITTFFKADTCLRDPRSTPGLPPLPSPTPSSTRRNSALERPAYSVHYTHIFRHLEMPTPASSHFSASRARSYIFRLPLFTRIAIFAIFVAWVVQVAAPGGFDVKAWGALVPAEVSLSSCKYIRCIRVGGEVDEHELTKDVCSIPHKYLPVHTPRVLPHDPQRAGVDAVNGEVRERVWDVDGTCAFYGP